MKSVGIKAWIVVEGGDNPCLFIFLFGRVVFIRVAPGVREKNNKFQIAIQILI